MITRLLLLASALLLSAEMAMAQDYSVPVSEKNEKMMEGVRLYIDLITSEK